MILILDLKKVSDKNPAAKLNKKCLEKLVLCDNVGKQHKDKDYNIFVVEILNTFQL